MVTRCTRLPCGCVGIEIVSKPQSGIAVGMLENMERLKSRELDGMFDPYLGIRNASSEHRFLRSNTGGSVNGVSPSRYGIYFISICMTTRQKVVTQPVPAI